MMYIFRMAVSTGLINWPVFAERGKKDIAKTLQFFVLYDEYNAS